MDTLSFYAGKVVRAIGPRAAGLFRHRQLDALIDHGKKRVGSVTGELKWNHGLGIAIINAPKVRGVVGFASIAPIKLGDVTIKVRNEFASVLLVSLDDRPIDQSRRIVVQAFTRQRPYGYRTEDGRITDMGAPPIGVEKIKVTLSLHGAAWRDAKVAALDAHGQPRAVPISLTNDGASSVQLHLDEQSLYHLIQR